MKRLLSVLMMAMPFLVLAQDGGVQFEEGLTWEQVKAKAKAENKYIFVDCYATWCTPCKEMDKNVYPNDTVANYVNHRFISVKVQLDSSQKDNDNIKLLYPAARAFEKEYTISGIPTFLFFSPNGQIVHKDEGGKNVQTFISLISDASNPNKQLFTLINKWKQGNFSYEELPALAKRIKTELKEIELANEIAKYYMLNYLDKLPENVFLKKEHLQFLRGYGKMITTNDRIFKAYCTQSLKIDSLMAVKNYCKNFILYIISNSLLLPAAAEADKVGSTPEWNNLYQKIKLKTDPQIAALAIASAKIAWYQKKKDHKNIIKYMISEMELIGLTHYTNDFALNNRAMTVFMYSNDKLELKTALTWIERALEIDQSADKNAQLSGFFTPQQNTAARLDTKANLLYKLGRLKEAIEIEENVIKLLPQDSSFKETLQKMKAGISTWPVAEN